MKYDCELIRDIIPLVKDGVASDNSKTAVTLHISECPVCRELYETDTQGVLPVLNENISTEISKVTHYKNRIKRRRKVIISLAVLFSVILVTGSCLATVHFVKRFVTGDSYTTRSLTEYRNYSGHIDMEKEGLFSLLDIFPNEIPQSAEVKDYYYFCSNGGLFDNSYQLFLLCSYEEGDFIREKERLESIEITYRDMVQKPVITDIGFDYCAVVTVFDYKDSFEYALIDDDTNTIAYVFAQTMGIDKSVVPSQYQPKGFMPPKDSLNEFGNYNAYYFKINDPLSGSVYVMPENR